MLSILLGIMFPDARASRPEPNHGDMSENPDLETGFLEQLGQRVRNMRALRGMSRKVLAKVSGISERYIAQLESGKGNVSIVLLRRVSDAMGAHLEDLIPVTEPSPDWPVVRDLLRKATPNQIAQAKDVLAGQGATAQRRMSFAGIALIGLRGAGKSTLGKMLAKKIGWSFVELNKEIEAQNGLSVAEIIALYGQEGFRRMEQAALGQLLARNELMVLATGGGIVSEPLTFDLILSSFYTIWVKAEPEEHMARVRGQGDLRPMADDRSAMAELRTILRSREPLYARASAVVDTAGLSVDAAAARLIEAVAPVLQTRCACVRAAQRGVLSGQALIASISRGSTSHASALFPGVTHQRNRPFKILAEFLANLFGEFIPLFRRDGLGRNGRAAISRPVVVCDHAVKIDPPPVIVTGCRFIPCDDLGDDRSQLLKIGELRLAQFDGHLPYHGDHGSSGGNYIAGAPGVKNCPQPRGVEPENTLVHVASPVEHPCQTKQNRRRIGGGVAPDLVEHAVVLVARRLL